MLANLYKKNNEYWIYLESLEEIPYEVKRTIDLTKEKIDELMESPSKVKEYFLNK